MRSLKILEVRNIPRKKKKIKSKGWKAKYDFLVISFFNILEYLKDKEIEIYEYEDGGIKIKTKKKKRKNRSVEDMLINIEPIEKEKKELKQIAKTTGTAKSKNKKKKRKVKQKVYF